MGLRDAFRYNQHRNRNACTYLQHAVGANLCDRPPYPYGRPKKENFQDYEEFGVPFVA